MQYTVFALPSILSATFMFFLFMYTLLRRRNTTCAWQFISIMICGWLWALGMAMVLMNSDLNTKLFWFNLAQIGPDFSPIFWILLAMDYTGRRNMLNVNKVGWLFVFPILTTTLMWTNDLHHLLRRSISLGTLAETVTYLQIERGPWFWVEVSYCYLFIFSSLILLVRFWTQSSSKRQTAALIIGLIIPVAANVLDILEINPLKPFGSTSIVFSVTGIVLAWGLFRERLLDITPIARGKVLEDIRVGIIVVDVNSRIVDANPFARRLLNANGVQSDNFIGMRFSETELPLGNLEKYFSRSEERKGQIALRDNGQQHFFDVIVSPLYTRGEAFVGWVATFHDITEQKEANERLQNQLYEIQNLQKQLQEWVIRDPLTGCYNRRYLEESLPNEISHAMAEEMTVGLIMLDIDHFKRINDNYGHATGDQVLQHVVKRLQMNVRQGDLVCRFGGEEFLVVLPDISLTAAIERANEFRSLIAGVRVPTATDPWIQVTASAGVAVYPVHGGGIEELIEHVDQALYAAKRNGRNCVRTFEELSAGE